MEQINPNCQPGKQPRRWLLRPTQIIITATFALVAVFYAGENWLGKHVWVQVKRDLEAKGALLDWSAYVPPAVPDDQNVFRAPGMTELFGSKQPGLSSFRFGTLAGFPKVRTTDLLAKITVIQPEAGEDTEPFDLLLQYRYALLKIPPPAETNTVRNAVESVAIPLIVMDEVPLTYAIKNLARQANIKYVIDPRVGLYEAGAEPVVNIRWQNVTANQALLALLNTYGLQAVGSPKTETLRIVSLDSSGPKVRVTPDVHRQIASLAAKALATNGPPFPRSLKGSQGYTLLARPLAAIKPLRIVVRSETVPTTKEVSDFFADDLVAWAINATNHLRIESAASNTFSVFLGAPLYYTADDYLAWSDQFVGDFDLMREALKRPYARLDGDYSQPVSVPSLSFVTMRIVTQTLSQRAQCFLLLGEPGEAVRELTLIHQLCRLMQPKALQGRALNIVAAMINVAVTGLYVEVIADGLRMHAWREADLADLQQQLKEIELAPALQSAFKTEQAALCRELEILGPERVIRARTAPAPFAVQPGFWQIAKDSCYGLLALAPRGWTYQNMATVARIGQFSVEAYEPATRTLSPRRVEGIGNELRRAFGQISSRNFIAAICVPDFSRAWQHLAKAQTRANQAIIVCALERYRLSAGVYPETLDDLVPRFVDTLPREIFNGQPFRYRRCGGGDFLLYSVGWNEKDDGGVVPLDAQGAALKFDDWAW